MRHQDVIFSLTGQSFFYDPPEGRATGTPTVEVRLATNDDTQPALSATTGSCSVDAVNTTLSSGASAGAQSLSVASGSSITRGLRYLLTDTDGDSEIVEVASITGTTVGLKRPLFNAYASSSTFQGTRISISIDSTWVATQANLTDVLSGQWRTDVPAETNAFVGQAGYRLRWSYTVNSVACLGVSFADLVRYQAKNLVSPLDVEQRFPGWLDRLPTDERENQGSSVVLEAFHAVRMDAIADSVLLRKVRNTEVLRELVIYRAKLMAVENDVMCGSGNLDGLEAARVVYAQRYDQLLREPKFPTDTGGGGASAQSPRQPIFRR